MPATYDSIATTTLGSAAGTITFSSIPSTYTDLRLVLVARGGNFSSNVQITYNQQSGPLYSSTVLIGDGSSSTSSRAQNESSISRFFNNFMSTTQPTFITLDIFSYAGSTNKTTLASTTYDRDGSGETREQVALFRYTPAINRIDIDTSGFLAAGTIATLYGIKAA